MKNTVRLMWLLVIAGGAAICWSFAVGPWRANNNPARLGTQPLLWTWAWALLLMVTVFASRRSAATGQPAKRLKVGPAILLILLVAAAMAIGRGKLPFPQNGDSYHSLDEILASPNYSGFEIAKPPDRPGPYKELGTMSEGEGIGKFWANGKSCEVVIPAAAGNEFRAVGLLPEVGGAPTYVLLKRRVGPPPSDTTSK